MIGRLVENFIHSQEKLQWSQLAVYFYEWSIEQLESLKQNSTNVFFWNFPKLSKSSLSKYSLKNIGSNFFRSL